jgi:hypothetical protein
MMKGEVILDTLQFKKKYQVKIHDCWFKKGGINLSQGLCPLFQVEQF